MVPGVGHVGEAIAVNRYVLRQIEAVCADPVEAVHPQVQLTERPVSGTRQVDRTGGTDTDYESDVETELERPHRFSARDTLHFMKTSASRRRAPLDNCMHLAFHLKTEPSFATGSHGLGTQMPVRKSIGRQRKMCKKDVKKPNPLNMERDSSPRDQIREVRKIGQASPRFPDYRTQMKQLRKPAAAIIT
jgi:hypothetical protein